MHVAPWPEPAPGTPPLLEVQKLASGSMGAAAVADFSMTISAGESVGLVGESGSGKSTTSRIICRLIDPSEGEIAFEDSRSVMSRHAIFTGHRFARISRSSFRIRTTAQPAFHRL
jgi:ABC-type oligopeptide transport system ATPase subunit